MGTPPALFKFGTLPSPPSTSHQHGKGLPVTAVDVSKLSSINMDLSRRPPVRVKCARKGCGKCLYCLKIEALCECAPEDRKGEPKNVMYGWCVKCRGKFPEDYKKLVGNPLCYRPVPPRPRH